MVDRVVRYKEREPLMEAFGVEQEIRSTLEPPRRPALRRLPDLRLRRGVHRDRRQHRPLRRLALEERRARRLEDTITKNNLEAVKEVVRQLRLRDVGGIIVIDFIDMANPKNRAAGRGRAAPGARARPHEDLRGRDLAARPRRDDAPERHRRPARGDDPQVPDLRRRRDRRLRGDDRGRGRAPAARARHARLAREGVQGRAEREDRGAGRRPRGARLAELEETDEAPVLPRRHPGRRTSTTSSVLDQGAVEKVAPAAAGRRSAQELELKLGEVGLYDPHAGVAQARRASTSSSPTRRSSSARR